VIKQFLPISFLKVTEDSELQRIDNFLRKTFKKLPINLIYKIIRTGQIRINKKRITPNYKLKLDDIIRIPPMTKKSTKDIHKTSNLKLSTLLNNTILYEDNYLLVLNKPSGIAVHSGSGINCGIIENLRSSYLNKNYLDLVHRLDRNTSGVLIIAKKRSILRILHTQLREKKIKKKICCISSWNMARYATIYFSTIIKNHFEKKTTYN